MDIELTEAEKVLVDDQDGRNRHRDGTGSYLQAVGTVLMLVRKRHKRSQTELGKMSGVQQASISRMEAGIGGLDIENVRKVCLALCIRPSELLKLAEDFQSNKFPF